jgi:hypothetical protein
MVYTKPMQTNTVPLSWLHIGETALWSELWLCDKHNEICDTSLISYAWELHTDGTDSIHVYYKEAYFHYECGNLNVLTFIRVQGEFM